MIDNTDFKKIPPQFIERYKPQFEVWAREFRIRGKRQAILFERRPGAPSLLDAEGRVIQRGAWLEAEVDRSNPLNVRVVIKPATDHDEELIARHTRELMLH